VQADLLLTLVADGERVTVWRYADHLEVYYRERLVERLPRLYHEGQAHRLRHVVRTLVRKPGGVCPLPLARGAVPQLGVSPRLDALRSRLGERSDT